MEAVWRLLSLNRTSPPPPPKHEDDVVYPLHFMDNTNTHRSVIMNWMLHFNDVLDPDMLRDSLARLLEMDDWRKVGGRLRSKSDGGIEIHAPTTFTPERPAFTYSHQKFEVSVDEHPLAKRLPKPTDRPSVHPDPRDFQALAPPVRDMKDLLTDDTPLLHLHITSFTDHTLVTLSVPHVLTDVMGQNALVRAWSLVLSGKISEVPPLLGAREDITLKAIETSTATPEPFKMASQQMSIYGMITLALRMLWSALWSSASTKTIYIPAPSMARLTNLAKADLPPDTFISTSDILTTYLSHTVACSLPSPRPVTIANTVNARFRLSLIKNSNGVFMQNMALASYTFFSAEEIHSTPLGILALRGREALKEQATEGQALAFIRYLKSTDKGKGPSILLCGPANATLMPFTDWSRADVFNVADFSAAVVQNGGAKMGRKDSAADVLDTTVKRTNPPGTPIYQHGCAGHLSPMFRNVVAIWGKDHLGGYWVTGTFSGEVWKGFERALKELA